MESLPFVLCLFISIFQFLFLIFLYKTFWKKNTISTLILIKVFFYVNLYRIIFNFIIVDILRIISGGAENKEYGVTGYEILQVYLLEFISNLIYFSVFTLLLFAIKSTKKKNAGITLKKQVQILIIICILYICDQAFLQVFSRYFWLVKDAIYFIGPICSLLLLVIGIKNKKKLWILIGLFPLVITIILSLIAGLRGSIVGVSICFIIISFIELNRSQFKRALIIGILPILLLVSIQEKLKEIKYAFAVGVGNKTIDVNSVEGYVNFVVDFLNDDLKSGKIDIEPISIFREIEFRYGAPSLFSVGFLRIGSRDEFVYFEPILNSFYSFLPKQLLDKDKPVSGSVDGTEKTMGMYVCVKEITGSDTSMTDFFVSGHYYWELGWLGVFLFSIVPALYNIFIVLLARNWGYLGIALFILSFKWLLSKLWLSEIIILISTVILPAIFLIVILNYILSIKKQ